MAAKLSENGEDGESQKTENDIVSQFVKSPTFLKVAGVHSANKQTSHVGTSATRV